jgi:biopolymer transport protein ExbD
MDSGEPEFQIAPMIDVLLVMLIFFMTITSAQVLRVDKNIKLPIGTHAQRKENVRSEAIVNVRWESGTRRAVFTFLDKLYANPDDLVPELRAAKETSEGGHERGQNPDFRVVIRADRDVPALYVSQVMNAAGQAGAGDISFSAVNRD